MKIYVYFFICLIMIAIVFAYFIEDEIEDSKEYHRQTKSACNYICTIHCVERGYIPGYCNSINVCLCRIDNKYMAVAALKFHQKNP
ncbi:defensin-like [Monomorium pharaonis]|uniref:defensin-like n=1 Tax=Monomorium pharaonis TaxID=307658 RepID=UPI0017475EA0|nr:defensin-like [Monomorium pharaonis]